MARLKHELYRLSFCYILATGCLFFTWTLFTFWLCNCEPSESELFDEVSSGNKKRHVELRTSFLTILILTGPGDEKRRNLIRETWLKGAVRARRTVFHIFPLGVGRSSKTTRATLHDEQTKHGDLVFLENHVESFKNLTGKMLESFAEISSIYDFDFLLKVDDDSFVQIEPLVAELENVGTPRLYYGFIDGRAHVKKRGKYTENGWNLCDRYLPYALGGGYILGKDLVQYLVENRQLLRVFGAEDVSVGAWIAGLNVDYVHEPRFDTEYMSRGCSNEYLITHKQNESQILEKWNNLELHGKLCQEEYRIRRSYLYNWNVPPSQCCNRTSDLSVP